MGLIKAITGAAGGVLADQWKEFFYCEAIDKEILAVKGEKRTGGRSSNTKGSDNIIILFQKCYNGRRVMKENNEYGDQRIFK